MSYIKALAGETVIYGLGYVLPRIAQFVFSVFYFTRILPQADYGAQGILYAFIGLVLVTVTLRMETALFRFSKNETSGATSYSTGFYSIVLVAAVILSIIWIQADHLSVWITTAGQSRLVRYLAIITFFDACAALPFARLRYLQKARTYAYLKIFNTIFYILVLVCLIEGLPLLTNTGVSIPDHYLHPNKYLDYIFYANIAASTVVFVVLFFYEIPRWSFWSSDHFKKMLRYALPLIPVSIAGMINMQADQWMIKELVPGQYSDNLSGAGVYVAAKRLAMIMIIFTTAFNYAAEPFFFRRSEDKNAPKLYAQVATAYSAVSTVIMCGVILFLDFFAIWIGEELRGGIFIIPISIIAYYFLGLYYNVSIWYKIKDKTHYGTWISLVGVVITIVLNVLLLPKIGIIGAAWAALACFTIMTFLCVLTGRRFFVVRYQWRKIMSYLLLVLGCIALTHFIPDLGLILNYGWRVAIILGICLLMYRELIPLVKK